MLSFPFSKVILISDENEAHADDIEMYNKQDDFLVLWWCNKYLSCHSRAIYFFSYANMKTFLNSRLTPDTPVVHFLSALTAGKYCIDSQRKLLIIQTCESGLGRCDCILFPCRCNTGSRLCLPIIFLLRLTWHTLYLFAFFIVLLYSIV